MKKNKLPLLLLIVALSGCGKKFPASVIRAEKEFSEKNYVDAIDTLNNGIPKWRESQGTDLKGKAYELLGKSYHQIHNTDKAIEAYQQAVALSNKSFDSAMALGNLHLVKNQPKMAHKSFSDALRMKPNDPLALLGMGNFYFLDKNIPEAISSFEKVLDTSPGVRDAMEQLAALKSLSHKKTARTVTYKKTPLRIQTHHKKR